MRIAIPGAALVLIACASLPEAADGGADSAELDAAPRWVQMECAVTDAVPVEGIDEFCPSVHEWERLVRHSCVDGSWYLDRDAGRVDCDAGDGGEQCRPRTEFEACSRWVRCPMSAGVPDCFHCLDFGDNPAAAPIGLPFDAGPCP